MTTTMTPVEDTSTQATAIAPAPDRPEPVTRRVRADLVVGLGLLAALIGLHRLSGLFGL